VVGEDRACTTQPSFPPQRPAPGFFSPPRLPKPHTGELLAAADDLQRCFHRPTPGTESCRESRKATSERANDLKRNTSEQLQRKQLLPPLLPQSDKLHTPAAAAMTSQGRSLVERAIAAETAGDLGTAYSSYVFGAER